MEKIWKLEKSDNKDKIYDAIIDLKSEIEGSCDIEVDLDKHMDAVEKELKKRGYKVSKKQLVFGVTLTLCGLFLMLVPFPACKPWGERMIASGFVICGNCISGKMDNDHKNDKDKGKK